MRHWIIGGVWVLALATLARAVEPKGDVEVVRDGGVVKVSLAGKPVLVYQGPKSTLPAGYDPAFQRGGYIHPVYTPAGTVVTDDYPPNHKHHHGIWSPWTKTEFEGRHPDFWNMGDKTGTVEFVEFGETYSGPGVGGFRTKHRMVDLSAKPNPKPAIEEMWDVTVYRGGEGYYVFDLAITQTCASDSPLLLPKYHYGGLGFRGNRQWDGKNNATLLTSEGKNRNNGNETRGKWCLMSGKVDGKTAAIVIMDHPENFRHPQPMRLHPTEPFFCYAPSQLGDWSIQPGKPYMAKYRFVVSDGVMDRAEIEQLWKAFAEAK